jgi:hypothetical protein
MACVDRRRACHMVYLQAVLVRTSRIAISTNVAADGRDLSRWVGNVQIRIARS